MTDLDLELATYESKLPELLGSVGKFVVIKGEKVYSTFDTYNDGLKYAYKEFGISPFLIKKIAPAEQISFFTRDICVA